MVDDEERPRRQQRSQWWEQRILPEVTCHFARREIPSRAQHVRDRQLVRVFGVWVGMKRGCPSRLDYTTLFFGNSGVKQARRFLRRICSARSFPFHTACISIPHIVVVLIDRDRGYEYDPFL